MGPMSSVEHFCSGTCAVEDRELLPGCQAEPDSKLDRFSATSVADVRGTWPWLRLGAADGLSIRKE